MINSILNSSVKKAIAVKLSLVFILLSMLSSLVVCVKSTSGDVELEDIIVSGIEKSAHFEKAESHKDQVKQTSCAHGSNCEDHLLYGMSFLIPVLLIVILTGLVFFFDFFKLTYSVNYQVVIRKKVRSWRTYPDNTVLPTYLLKFTILRI